MKKLILSLATICFFIFNSNSQCAFTGTPLTQVGGTNTFCIDNIQTITTALVRPGQYVVVNVVQGFGYTFSIADVFAGLNENLTLLNTSNTSLSPAVFVSGATGTSISWTATFSGQIKILVSKGACVNDGSPGGVLTLVLNTATNTLDSQTAFGTDNWIGHVYNWVGASPPGGASPTSPTASYPFVSAGYAGYYSIPTENFVEGFGGDGVCFPLLTAGVNRTNIFTQQYAVRYRMRSTKVGCYSVNFNGDDGIRIYVDGVRIFNEWKDQAPTNYANVIVYLNGNSDIVFDYYENGGQNRANFSIAPFNAGSNAVANPTINTFCSAATPAILDGSSFVYNGATVNPTLAFQWQISNDNVTFTNIAGATLEDFQPVAVTTTTVNIPKYYRRIVTAVAATASSCVYTSNSVLITTTPGIFTTPATIIGNANQCPALTNQIYSVAIVPSATSYNWAVPAGWTITSGAATNSITVTTGASGQNGIISCSTNFPCGSSSFRNLNVTVNPTTVAGNVTAAQTICSGTSPADISSGGRTGNIIRWEKAPDLAFTAPINIAVTNSTLTSANIGTLTNSAYFRAVVQSGTCQILNSTPVLITVIASVPGTVSSNQTICTGTTPSNLSLSGNVGNVVKWQSSTNIAFTSPTDIANTTTTLTGASIGNLTATTYFRAVVQNGSCTGTNTNIITITISPLTIAGTVSSNQAICSGTAPSNLSLSGNVGNVVKWQSSADLAFTAPIDIANTTTTLTGATIGNLTATTYFRAVVQSGTCADANTNAVTVTIATTEWDGTMWDNGTPTITTTAIISGNFTSTADLFACSLTVTNSAIVSILSTHNVTLNGKLTVSSGSFTLNNNANLLQQTDVANTGNIIVKRNTSLLMRQDYTVWSSPVANQNLLAFSPQTLTTRFYNYNTNTNLYNAVPSPSTTTFATAQGYLIRTPNNHPTTPTTYTGTFTGVPNNGPLNVTMTNLGTGKRFNMIGNPYASTLNMASFVAANTNNITGSLYFWRKTNSTATTVPYCTWTAGTFISNGEAQVFNPLGIINSGQGFFVEAKNSATSVDFTNSMRVVNNNNQFFRNANTTEYNRIWLNATNNAGLFCQTAIGYNTNSTLGLDEHDGRFINDGGIAIASLIGLEAYASQGRQLPFDNNDVVPISFTAATAGNFAIAIDHVDGLFSGNSEIYLRDNFTNTINNLTTGSYSFAANAGKDDTRFELMYQPTVLTTIQNNFNENNVIIFKSNEFVNINSGNINMNKVKIYDIQGRLLLEKTSVNANKTQIDVSLYSNQILIIQIVFENNLILNRKIVN
jgi:hypothetical protein